MDKQSVEDLKSKFKSSELPTEGLNEHEAKFWISIEERVESGEKVDAHTARAAYEYGIPESEVTAEQRSSAKALNFYRMYTTNLNMVGFGTKLTPIKKLTTEEAGRMTQAYKVANYPIQGALVKKCSKCGKEFKCTGNVDCWCMKKPLPANPLDKTQDCMCEECLSKA